MIFCRFNVVVTISSPLTAPAMSCFWKEAQHSSPLSLAPGSGASKDGGGQGVASSSSLDGSPTAPPDGDGGATRLAKVEDEVGEGGDDDDGDMGDSRSEEASSRTTLE